VNAVSVLLECELRQFVYCFHKSSGLGRVLAHYRIDGSQGPCKLFIRLAFMIHALNQRCLWTRPSRNRTTCGDWCSLRTGLNTSGYDDLNDAYEGKISTGSANEPHHRIPGSSMLWMLTFWLFISIWCHNGQMNEWIFLSGPRLGLWKLFGSAGFVSYGFFRCSGRLPLACSRILHFTPNAFRSVSNYTKCLIFYLMHVSVPL